MNKQNFQSKASQTIDEIFDKIDELEAKKDHTLDEANPEIENMISELHSMKDELLASYARLFNADEENWEEVKYAFSAARVSFREGVEGVVERREGPKSG